MMLFNMIDGVFRIFEVAIIIECLSSWIPQIRYNKFIEIIHMITEPVLEPCRRLQYKFFSNMPVDFSPIIAFVAINIIRGILITIL